MTNSSPWKDPPILQLGKPSISIRAIYTMAMLNNPRLEMFNISSSPFISTKRHSASEPQKSHGASQANQSGNKCSCFA